MTALGIDIGGSSIKAAILDGGVVRWTGQSPRYSRPDGATVQALLSDLLVPAPLPADVGGLVVGLCVPGVYAPEAGAIARSVNMPGLVRVPLRELIARGLRHPAGPARLRVVSDAHAAAYDVFASTGLAGRLLGISLGTGVGAAVLDDGVLLRVSGASSGHLGQVDVTVPGLEPAPVGPDGGRGSLEAYIGLPALLARHGGAVAWLEDLRGDEPELLALVRAIRICHAIYRPNHVALLGGLGIRLSGVLGSIRERVGADLTGLAQAGWTLRCGEHDHHAAAGAARLGLVAGDGTGNLGPVASC